MTKQEKIQEAYGEKVWNILDDSVLEFILNNNGWLIHANTINLRQKYENNN